jgi:hypothetical protein
MTPNVDARSTSGTRRARLRIHCLLGPEEGRQVQAVHTTGRPFRDFESTVFVVPKKYSLSSVLNKDKAKIKTFVQSLYFF